VKQITVSIQSVLFQNRPWKKCKFTENESRYLLHRK